MQLEEKLGFFNKEAGRFAGRIAMLIQVLYEDNRYDYVKGFQLDRLLEVKKVQKFKRSSGWVTVGVDPIRWMKSPSYDGEERRAA
jgi:hypothetical protein